MNRKDQRGGSRGTHDADFGEVLAVEWALAEQGRHVSLVASLTSTSLEIK